MNSQEDLSARLRQRRSQIGLSLCDLARRADTSPATLCRYESGWTRFELYTLRKLASALGCRLRITLEPITRPRKKIAKAQAVRRLRRLFWDKRLQQSDLDEYPTWVLRRVLEYGALEDVHLLIDILGRDTFLETVAQIRFSEAKTREFWRNILEKEGVPCTKKLFQRTAQNF